MMPAGLQRGGCRKRDETRTTAETVDALTILDHSMRDVVCEYSGLPLDASVVELAALHVPGSGWSPSNIRYSVLPRPGAEIFQSLRREELRSNWLMEVLPR